MHRGGACTSMQGYAHPEQGMGIYGTAWACGATLLDMELEHI